MEISNVRYKIIENDKNKKEGKSYGENQSEYH